MSANDYHLVSQWHVLGTTEECYGIISAADQTPHWWPAASPFAAVAERAGGRCILSLGPADDRVLHQKARAVY